MSIVSEQVRLYKRFFRKVFLFKKDEIVVIYIPTIVLFSILRFARTKCQCPFVLCFGGWGAYKTFLFIIFPLLFFDQISLRLLFIVL